MDQISSLTIPCKQVLEALSQPELKNHTLQEALEEAKFRREENLAFFGKLGAINRFFELGNSVHAQAAPINNDDLDYALEKLRHAGARVKTVRQRPFMAPSAETDELTTYREAFLYMMALSQEALELVHKIAGSFSVDHVPAGSL